jgi:hypothetical protein
LRGATDGQPDRQGNGRRQVATAVRESRPKGGWRAQPLALRVLLVASLVFIATGVYRCSGELVPSQGSSGIRVERATVALPDSLLATPPDSMASIATRMFARALRETYAGDVTMADDVSEWAVARLHLRSAPDGRIELIGSATSAVSGRRLSAVRVQDTPDRLREMAAQAARAMAGQLAAADASGREGR